MSRIDAEYDLKCQTRGDINEHLPTLKDYASHCSHVTEMGVRDVVSTWAFLAARPKFVRSYDIEYHPNMRCAQTIAKEEGVDIQFIIANTTCTQIEPTELLFIDTLHIYEQLQKELRLHADKVSKYIAFHDTTIFAEEGEISNSKGLMPAINEFLETHSEWKIALRHSNNNGLTIISK